MREISVATSIGHTYIFTQVYKNFLVCPGLPVESEKNLCLCVAVECRWMHMDRERGKGAGEREHERSRQEKEARVGWVIRQIQIGVV